jgi:hypothetical protein
VLRALRWIAIVAAVVFVVATRDAKAWGVEGHDVIADIAEMGLSPIAQGRVRSLLALEGKIHLDAVATWADDYRISHRETARYHFVNVPVGSSGYVASRDCLSGCLVSKLEAEIATLGAHTGGIGDLRKLEALKWITHLVGDASQPLHMADNGDGGGNDVRFLGFADGSSAGPYETLHSAWDEAFIYRLDGKDAHAIADRLAKTIDRRAIEDASVGGIVDWVNEGWRLAVTVAYRIPGESAGVHSDALYERRAIEIVNGQLVRAGIRLANILNDQLGQAGGRQQP